MEQAEYMASSAIGFLADLFNDRIIMWGSHSGVGGFYRRDETQKKPKISWFGLGGKKSNKSEWVWSGKIDA